MSAAHLSDKFILKVRDFKLCGKFLRDRRVLLARPRKDTQMRRSPHRDKLKARVVVLADLALSDVGHDFGALFVAKLGAIFAAEPNFARVRRLRAAN